MGIRIAAYDLVTTLMAGFRGFYNPVKAAHYRIGREMYKRSFFDAADRKGVDGRWGVGKKSRSADSEIYNESGLIVDRCRDLARNNANIVEALNKICNNVVRNGIKPQARLKTAAGQFDEKTNEKLEALWKRWTKPRYVDPTGHDSLAAICRLVLRHEWVDGELFVRRIWSKDLIRKGVIPFHLEALEREYLAREIHGQQANGTMARNGIEYDSLGRPVAYHFYIGHPGDALLLATRETRRIDASDVLHIFERKRASQGRGLSWMAAVVMEIFSFADYLKIERNGARVAASVALYLKSVFPEAMGDDPPSYSYGGETGQGTASEKAARTLEEFTSQQHLLTKLPGQTDLEVVNHNRPGTQFEPYVKTSQRTHSNGFSLSYSSYSGDYTDSSFSSDRSSKLEERLGFKGQQTFLVEKFLEPLWIWAMEGIYMAGLLPMPGYQADPDRWWDAVEWDLPGWTWAGNPLQDSKAAGNDIALGLSTRKKQCATRGENFDENADQLLIEEKKLLEIAKVRQERLALEKEMKNAETPAA